MEEFYDILGFEGYYKINKAGEVISLDKRVLHPVSKSVFVKGRVMKQCKNTKGYLMVRLSKNGVDKLYLISRLLAIAFIPNPLGYRVVRHLNDIKTDNRLSNLAWGTNSHNVIDSIRNGKFNGRVKIRIILDTGTGIFYNGVREAADAKCVNYRTLEKRLRGEIKNITGLVYT